jgi:hypothetical protein
MQKCCDRFKVRSGSIISHIHSIISHFIHSHTCTIPGRTLPVYSLCAQCQCKSCSCTTRSTHSQTCLQSLTGFPLPPHTHIQAESGTGWVVLKTVISSGSADQDQIAERKILELLTEGLLPRVASPTLATAAAVAAIYTGKSAGKEKGKGKGKGKGGERAKQRKQKESTGPLLAPPQTGNHSTTVMLSTCSASSSHRYCTRVSTRARGRV